jgi:membrane associated rhomboid family serine protease
MSPFIGASGAISGILSCYFLLFPTNKVKVYWFLFPFIVDFFVMPARMFMGFYLLADNIYPFISLSPQGINVAHASHIGGFLAGLFLVSIYKLLLRALRTSYA